MPPSVHTSQAQLARLKYRAEQTLASNELWQSRSEKILAGANPVQRRFILNDAQYKALRCPRRAGKSFAMTSLALYHAEKNPGARILIISLTLKSTRENFWSGAPGGLFKQNHEYGLGLKFNHTDSVWWHENGSRGRLAGAETRADIEYLRGAAAEADIAIVDECKSFAPDLLAELIRDVLEPGLMTRNGKLVLGGTPGLIPLGTFFEATCEASRRQDPEHPAEQIPTCIPYGDTSWNLPADVVADLWSLHAWGIEDNVAQPHQWRRALSIKRRNGWGDDHPTWRREFLGEWSTDTTDLVYAFGDLKRRDPERVTWYPSVDKGNPTGLPLNKGPWHTIMGLDFGYEDDFALVMAGYSETQRELRHFYDFKSPHLTVDQMAEEIIGAIDRYGQPEVIVADAGALGKLVVETLNQRYGLAIIAAEKKEKFDHIELMNSDFHSGHVLLIPGSDLDHELSGLQWDLSRESKVVLARTGKLREDSKCPNHLCDAFLYLWRFSYHYWAVHELEGPERGTPQWIEAQERAALAAALERRSATRDPHGLDQLKRHEPRGDREGMMAQIAGAAWRFLRR